MTVPAIIDVVTDKILAFLAIKEREELLGSIPFGKVRRPIEPDSSNTPTSRNLFGTPVDFRRPRPLPRLKTLAGGTSFHIGFTSVGRGGVSRGSKINDDGQRGRERKKDAAGFEAYIGDDVTAPSDVQTIAGGSFESYLGLPPQEQFALGAHTRVADVLSNIADHPRGRTEFWDGVEAGERRASEPGVALHPDRCSELWWQQAADQPRGDPAIDRAFRRIIKSFKRGAARSKRQWDRKPLRVACPPELALEIVRRLAEIPGWDVSRPAVTIPKPRAGRVQDRWEFEVPHEIAANPAALRRLLRRLAAFFESRGVMYTIVLHEPDGDNDRRNFHIHVITYNRKCRFIAAAEKWDIAMSAAERKKHGVKLANKLRVAAENGAYWKAGSRDATEIRSFFADLCNDELEGISADRHLDPRSYSLMGFDQLPQLHLNPAAARLSKVGVATAVETENMYRSVAGALAAIENGAERRFSQRRDLAKSAQGLVERLNASERDEPHGRQLEAHWHRYVHLVVEVNAAEAAIEKLDLFEQLARSRAEHVAQNCDRMMSYVAAGKAKRQMVRHREDLVRRGREAKAHLARLDEALLPFQADRRAAELSVDEAVQEIERLADIFHAELKRERSLELDGTIRSPAAEMEKKWDKLRNHIVRSKPVIVRSGEGFDVPSAADSDRALLSSPILAHRIRPFMLGQVEIQDREVDRLRSAIEARGLSGVESGIGNLATARQLLERYAERPDVRDWLATLRAATVDGSERGNEGSDDRQSLDGEMIDHQADAISTPLAGGAACVGEATGLVDATAGSPISEAVVPEIQNEASPAVTPLPDGDLPASPGPAAKRPKPKPVDPAVAAEVRRRLIGPNTVRETFRKREFDATDCSSPEIGTGALGHHAEPVTAPEPSLGSGGTPTFDPARADAVMNLRNALLTDPLVRVCQTEQGLVIRPLCEGWHNSVRAFSEEPEILEAMKERAASPWLDLTEDERTNLLHDFEIALRQANRRPTTRVREENRWDIHDNILDPEITELMRRWLGHEKLNRVLSAVDAHWSELEYISAQRDLNATRDPIGERHRLDQGRQSRAPSREPQHDPELAVVLREMERRGISR